MRPKKKKKSERYALRPFLGSLRTERKDKIYRGAKRGKEECRKRFKTGGGLGTALGLTIGARLRLMRKGRQRGVGTSTRTRKRGGHRTKRPKANKTRWGASPLEQSGGGKLSPLEGKEQAETHTTKEEGEGEG